MIPVITAPRWIKTSNDRYHRQSTEVYLNESRNVILGYVFEPGLAKYLVAGKILETEDRRLPDNSLDLAVVEGLGNDAGRVHKARSVTEAIRIGTKIAADASDESEIEISNTLRREFRWNHPDEDFWVSIVGLD